MKKAKPLRQPDLFGLAIDQTDLRRMRVQARANGKTVPTPQELLPLVGTHCPRCKRPFEPEPSRKKASRPSLQHMRDATFAIWCHACNAADGQTNYPELLGTAPKGKKLCGCCGKIKSLASFAKNTTRRGNRHSQCKRCDKLRSEIRRLRDKLERIEAPAHKLTE